MSNGDIALVVVNGRMTAYDGFEVDLDNFGEKGQSYSVRDLWKHADLGNFSGPMQVEELRGHGNVMLRLSKS